MSLPASAISYDRGGHMLPAHALPMDDTDHRCMPSIAIILIQHLYQRALAPGHHLSCTARVYAHTS